MDGSDVNVNVAGKVCAVVLPRPGCRVVYACELLVQLSVTADLLHRFKREPGASKVLIFSFSVRLLKILQQVRAWWTVVLEPVHVSSCLTTCLVG